MSNTRITFIKKDKGSYKVNIIHDDTELKFTITEDLLIESRFLSLKEIKEEEYNLFLSKLPKDYLLLTSLKYLDKRVKSEKEMREYLLNHTQIIDLIIFWTQFDLNILTNNDISTIMIDLINQTIDSLKKKNLLDDESYKTSLINELIYYKRDGRLLIMNKLSNAGLNDNFIYPLDALKDNLDKLTVIFDKKNHDLSYQDKINKLKVYLLRKGYTDEDLRYINYHLITKTNEISNLEKELEKLKKRFDDNNRIYQELLKKGYSSKDIDKIWGDYDK